MHIYEDLIMDLIENTNISETGFSVFHFYRDETETVKIKFCMIEEVGNLFFDKKSKYITFETDVLWEKDYLYQTITQVDVIRFFIKYLELDFNFIYRKDIEEKPVIEDIQLDIKVIKNFKVFQEVLFQLDIEL